METVDLKEEIVKNLDHEVYNKINAFRSSSINDLKIPKKYWYKHLSGIPKEEEDKQHFVMGSALHTLVIEPEHFFDRFIIYPSGIDRRTKDGKLIYADFLRMAGSKKILSQDDFEVVQGMSNSMKSHPKYDTIFVKSPNKCIEDSLFWQIDGTWIKSRPDFYNDDIIVDLKITREESPEDFIRSVIKYGYHRQAALQVDGLSHLKKKKYKFHIIFVVEKNPPYLCAMYMLDDVAINQGRLEYNNALVKYRECITNNIWPGYTDKVSEIYLPEWYINNNQTF